MVQHFSMTLPPFSKGFHLITNHILEHLGTLPENGLLNIFITHTSAGITINENADYTVRSDFENFLNQFVPEDFPYQHSAEGTDDMPAHIKASLTGFSVTIPIINSHLNLGTWQGIYLCEFRRHGGNRTLILTIYS